MIFRMM